MSDPPVPNERHPLDGTYAYFDSELEILVGPRSTYHLNGVAYYGFFSFSGRYSVLLSTGQRYYWPIIGGTINQLSIGGEMSQTGYEISCVMFSPNVVPSDPTHGSIDLSRFTDAWAGYAGVEPSGRVEMLQLRFLNVTFHPDDGSRIDSSSAELRDVARRRHLMSGLAPAPKASPTATTPEGSDQLPPIRTAWSAFSWQPTWEDFGARSYTRIK